MKVRIVRPWAYAYHGYEVRAYLPGDTPDLTGAALASAVQAGAHEVKEGAQDAAAGKNRRARRRSADGG